MSIFLFCIFFLALLLTLVLEKVADRLCLIDYPVDRSAHLDPKPSGGGIVIIGTFLSCTYFFNLNGHIPDHIFNALLGAVPIATVGLFDDLSNVSLRLRLPIQFLTAFWVIYWFGAVSGINLSFVEIVNPWILIFLEIVSLKLF